jgi:uncharacterized protein
VDQQVADWAARDGKPVAGLETLDEQLLLFKRLTADTQRELFLKTLAELATMQEAGALVAEWRAATSRRWRTGWRRNSVISRSCAPHS